jgi:hypothetical protein
VLGVVLGLAAGGFALRACGQIQNPPPPLPLDLVRQVQLNQQQIDQVRGHVKFWSDVLNAEGSTPADIKRAREELIKPFTQPGTANVITPDFRGTYSGFAVPEMDKAIKSTDVFRAINGLLVLSQLGTDRAVNLLLDHVDVQGEQRWQVRMHAASGVRMLLQDATLESRKVKEVCRRLREAVGREDNGLVLRHMFAALNVADAPPLDAGERKEVRGVMADALAAVAGRMTAMQQPSQPMIDAVSGAIVILRNKYLLLPSDEQAGLGAKLGPALGNLLKHAQTHWDDSHGDKALNQSMTIMIASCESFLQRIDPAVTKAAPSGQGARPTPATDLRNAWEGNDKGKFEAGVQAWESVLSKPPYKE